MWIVILCVIGGLTLTAVIVYKYFDRNVAFVSSLGGGVFRLSSISGKTMECEWIANYRYKGEEYGVFLPLEGENVIILCKVRKNDTGYVFKNTDTKTAARLFQQVKKEFRDKYDFV